MFRQDAQEPAVALTRKRTGAQGHCIGSLGCQAVRLVLTRTDSPGARRKPCRPVHLAYPVLPVLPGIPDIPGIPTHPVPCSLGRALCPTLGNT